MRKKTSRKARLPLLLALSLAGCSEALGLGDDYKAPVGSACLPGATKECSPEASGVCLQGFQACKQDGTGYDVCIATPAPPSAGCACAPGAVVPCYDGSPETLGKSACAAGKKTCGESGNVFGACEGQVLCEGQFRWAKLYGEAYGQTGSSVAVDGQGNVIVVGSVAGTVIFGDMVTQPTLAGPAEDDIFVLKLDPEGKVLWAKRMGDELPQAANAVAIDGHGNIVVAGAAAGMVDFGDGIKVGPVDPKSVDAFVIKLDPDGKLLWKLLAGDALAQTAEAVAVDDQNNVVVVAGSFEGAIKFETMPALTTKGGLDIFVAKLGEENGMPLWSKSFGGTENETGRAVAIDTHGNVIVTGPVQGMADFDGMGTMPAAMSTGMDDDVFVLKLDAATGTRSWVKRFGDNAGQGGFAIAADPRDDSVVITGEFGATLDFNSPNTKLTSAGLTDMFLAKLDSSGEVTWAKRFGDDKKAQGGRGVAIDSHGDIVLGVAVFGSVNFGADPGTLLTSAGQTDIGVAKLDSTGNHLWSKLFGDADFQSCKGVAVDAQGNVLLTGTVAGAVNFGGDLLPCAGFDIAVAKLSP